MTPSNQFPWRRCCCRRRCPRPIAPSFRIGLYRALGRLPSNSFVSVPALRIALLDGPVPVRMLELADSPFTMPVTYFQAVIGGLPA